MFNNDKIIKIDNWYWTSEDVPAYEYLKESHKNELDAILPHLTENEVAVQAGAHCGYVIRELLPHFKTIYTFEPDPTMFMCMCLNVPEENVYKFQGCLGDFHGLVKLEDNKAFPTAGARFVDKKGCGDIPTFRVDDLALDDCSLLMIDTEGYEYEILMGAYDTILEFHPLLCLERYWGERTLGKGTEERMDKLLENMNYKEVSRAGESDHVYKWQGEKRG